MKGSYEDTESGQPRPILRVCFRNPLNHTLKIELRCIVDTGMSACALPTRLIQRLKLVYPTSGITEDADGNLTTRAMWITRVEIVDFRSGNAGMSCGEIKVVELVEGARAIVGRNVLNQFSIALDGPDRTCKIE